MVPEVRRTALAQGARQLRDKRPPFAASPSVPQPYIRPVNTGFAQQRRTPRQM